MRIARTAGVAVVATCAALAAPAARAQDGGGASGWMQRMQLERLTDRLGLSDEQRTKVQALLTDSEKKRKEADDAQAAEIRKLLTAEQQGKYDALRAEGAGGGRGGWMGGQGGGGFGRGGFGGGGFGGGGFGGGGNQDPMDSPQMKELTELLGLTADQQQKIAEVSRTAMEKGRKRGEEIFREVREKMRAGEFDIDWTKLTDEFGKFFDELGKEIGAHLTPEQKPKFDKWMGELKTQMSDPSQWGRLGERFGGGGGGRSGRTQGEGDADLARILRDLNPTEDEKLVLAPAIEKILKMDSDQRRKRRNDARKLRDVAGSGADTDTVKKSIDEARKSEADHLAARGTAEAELRDLVTVSQEAVLVSHGVLK